MCFPVYGHRVIGAESHGSGAILDFDTAVRFVRNCGLALATNFADDASIS